MKKLIKRMFDKWFCLHTWDIHDEARVYQFESDKSPITIRKTLICSKCGKIKQIQL